MYKIKDDVQKDVELFLERGSSKGVVRIVFKDYLGCERYIGFFDKDGFNLFKSIPEGVGINVTEKGEIKVLNDTLKVLN